MNPDQHYRAVDQKTDGDQTDTVHQRSFTKFPIDKNKNGDGDHINHGRNSTSPLEDFITQPTTENRPGDSGKFIRKVSPTDLFDIVAFHLFQISRCPIEHSIADEIDKSVSDSDIPQYFITQYIFKENFFGRQFHFRLGTIVGWIVVSVLFDRWQTTRLRGIADQQISDHHNNQSDNSRKPEGTGLPGTEPGHPHGSHRSDQSPTDIMGHIPDRHFRPPFMLRKPVCHHPSARRPTHTLKPTD